MEKVRNQEKHNVLAIHEAIVKAYVSQHIHNNYANKQKRTVSPVRQFVFLTVCICSVSLQNKLVFAGNAEKIDSKK